MVAGDCAGRARSFAYPDGSAQTAASPGRDRAAPSAARASWRPCVGRDLQAGRQGRRQPELHRCEVPRHAEIRSGGQHGATAENGAVQAGGRAMTTHRLRWPVMAIAHAGRHASHGHRSRLHACPGCAGPRHRRKQRNRDQKRGDAAKETRPDHAHSSTVMARVVPCADVAKCARHRARPHGSLTRPSRAAKQDGVAARAGVAPGPARR